MAVLLWLATGLIVAAAITGIVMLIVWAWRKLGIPRIPEGPDEETMVMGGLMLFLAVIVIAVVIGVGKLTWESLSGLF